MDAEIVSIEDLAELIKAILKKESGTIYPIDVCVEDDNCEVRYVEYAWYDPTRKMLRLTLRNTLFTDNKV